MARMDVLYASLRCSSLPSQCTKTHHDRLAKRLTIFSDQIFVASFFHRFFSWFCLCMCEHAHTPTITTRIWQSRSNMFATHMLLYKCVHGLATNVQEMKKKRGENFWFCLLDDCCRFFFFSLLFYSFFSYVRFFFSYRLNQRDQENFVIVYTHRIAVAMATSLFPVGRRKYQPFGKKARISANHSFAQFTLSFAVLLCSARLFFCSHFFPPVPVDIGNGKSIGSWNQISIPLQR